MLKRAWLNSFLLKKENLIYWYELKNNSFILGLDLDMNRIWYINDNYNNFILILEKFLFIFNSVSGVKFNNITFNNIKIWDELFNNCIFLFNANDRKSWFVKTNWLIHFPRNASKWDIFDKIIYLAEENKLSVRKLIKIWFSQAKARKFYNMLKSNDVIKISEYNKSNKKYDIEKLKKIIEILRKNMGV